MYALPSAGGSATTHHFSTGEDGTYDFEDAAVVYVFDNTGTLVDVRRFDEKK